MNCHYCHNLCRNNVSTWICDTCQAEFGADAANPFTNLYTYINRKKYTFQMRYGSHHAATPCRILLPRLNDSMWIDPMGKPDPHIIYLPKIPDNVTPSNVQEKVKLYLLFS